MKSLRLFSMLSVAVIISACAQSRVVATAAHYGVETDSRAPGQLENALIEGQLPEVDPLQYEGTIVTAGSSTVFPLAERVAERFQDEGFSGNVTIDSIGTGAGFERFCVSGEIDISNASRPIKDSELESCHSIGRNPIEFRVGTDALAVTVSHENEFLQNVSLEELSLIFSSEVELWSEVNPAWPKKEILRFIPGTDSGTFDYFVEQVFDKEERPILESSNLQLSEDDNVLVQGILGSPHAIGFFGYGYFEENADDLRVVSIEHTEPTRESVDDGSYLLARPLFIYSDADLMRTKPHVAAYINFFLTHVNEEVSAAGYFPANPDALNQAELLWLEAMTSE
jgi:phosphate transport system substrate-binding protein